MKTSWYKKARYGIIVLSALTYTACTVPGDGRNKQQDDMTNNFKEGTYGYDAGFLSKNQVKTVELIDTASEARVLIVPAYQGRVMTSSASGNEGISFGWINYKLIQSGIVSSQFNPYGGEERLWLGPEGGLFSVYFKKGDSQEFPNWKVPKEIDTEVFETVSQKISRVKFKKDFSLVNYSGTQLDVGIERTVRILSGKEAETLLDITMANKVSMVAYESENVLTNKGKNDWNEQSGLLSIWMLSMFRPSPEGIVFIPIREGSETELGKKVSDDYFGKVPMERLIVKNDRLFFKVDGKYRSKIGISPQRALPYCGSYDSKQQVLTVLWYSKPENAMEYVNSKWGEQDDPLKGDAVNSYNDGPVEDGSVMGPFYEIESSSPAARLKAGEHITHMQRIFHFSGPEDQLNPIAEKLFGMPVSEIRQAFTNN